MTCDLYRFFDADNRLLYVGISLHAAARASQHRGEKAWWPVVARMDVEQLPTREEALEAERLAIVDEKPLHNVLHNTQPTPQLAWVCQHCEDLIADGTGYIGVDWVTAIRVEHAHRELEKQRRSWEPIQLAKLMGIPKGPHWYVTHRTCDPHPERDDYWFDVARCRTIKELLDWNDHLFGKRWTEFTNWTRFIIDQAA